MPTLIRPCAGPITQPFGSNATAGVVANQYGTTVQQLVYLYGNYQPGGHDGQDIGVGIGTPIIAPARVRIEFSGDARFMPDWVALKYGFTTDPSAKWATGLATLGDFGDGIGFYTAHMDRTDVDHLVGQWLNQGFMLGTSGNSGRSGGPHVHFSTLRFPVNYSDPLYSRFNPETLIADRPLLIGSPDPILNLYAD